MSQHASCMSTLCVVSHHGTERPSKVLWCVNPALSLLAQHSTVEYRMRMCAMYSPFSGARSRACGIPSRRRGFVALVLHPDPSISILPPQRLQLSPVTHAHRQAFRLPDVGGNGLRPLPIPHVSISFSVAIVSGDKSEVTQNP